MQLNFDFNGYWVSPYHLYKVENDIEVYRYLENGEWEKDHRVYNQFGWNDNYEKITETEAKKIMNRGKSLKSVSS